MQRTARGAGVAIAAALFVLGASSVQAQTPQPQTIGVEISPSKVERDLPDRSVSQTFQIVNHESESRRITMSVAGLGHDLEGAPVYLEPAKATNELHLSDSSFVLASGEKKTVTATGNIPSNDHSLYAAVIAEFAPLQQQSGTVESHSRVASLLLLRGPKPWTETVSVEDVGLLPIKDSPTFTVFAALKDTGNVHVRATGTARISKDGTLLATVPLTGQVILPGFARRIGGTWTPPAKVTGKVRVDVTTTPPGQGTATISFDDGKAPRPQLKIQNLRALDQSGALVTATLVNTGTVTVTPTITIFVRQGDIERARTILVEKAIPAGKSADIEWQPGLDDGVYVITAQARSGELLLDESSTGLRLGAVGIQGTARTTPKKSLLIVVAALLLALCIAALVLIWFRRRSKGDDRTSERPTAAAA